MFKSFMRGQVKEKKVAGYSPNNLKPEFRTAQTGMAFFSPYFDGALKVRLSG
jgi:hypothetical protein